MRYNAARAEAAHNALEENLRGLASGKRPRLALSSEQPPKWRPGLTRIGEVPVTNVLLRAEFTRALYALEANSLLRVPFATQLRNARTEITGRRLPNAGTPENNRIIEARAEILRLIDSGIHGPNRQEDPMTSVLLAVASLAKLVTGI